ncbi:MAG: YhcH/YjgK/YiaL family protein [Bacteroidota bacterium]
MIYDSITNAGLYSGLHPDFDSVFTELKCIGADQIPAPRKDLRGEDVYLLFFEIRGVGDAKLEHHRRYIDIHYVVEGVDHIGIRATHSCEQLVSSKLDKDDYALYADKADFLLPVRAGFFAVFFPDDAHAPLMGTTMFKKVVAKIRCQ